MPIDQQSGSAEPATEVFAKITSEEPKAAPAPAPVRRRRSLSRRLARRILGPTLMTRKD
ncbi:hypothetical protein AB0A63_22790 [Lentzea sp. NPDC042327]|uniref:hypothetical protein n=1 Tax=Lentzea sp. NPDC042327 TaxID=3154801 RepID=UPI0033CFD9B0